MTATATAPKFANANQLNYLRILLVKTGRVAEDNVDEAILAVTEVPAKTVSMMIDDLKAELANRPKTTPKPALTTELPAGRYALPTLGGDVLKYQIDRPEQGKWAGWTFVKDITSGKEAIRGKAAKDVVDRLARFGHLEAAKLYGKTTGTCGVCGRTLTNPDSIAAGIGPICAGKF